MAPAPLGKLYNKVLIRQRTDGADANALTISIRRCINADLTQQHVLTCFNVLLTHSAK